MEIKIIKNSATELIITQQRKLTVTGSLFCLPVVLFLFNWPGMPLILSITCCVLLWMIALHCFYKGVTYTFKASKTDQMLKVNVKSIFNNTSYDLGYPQIHHIIMAETDRLFNRSENWHYHIIIEASNNRRIKIFGFTNRGNCKRTAALIESYLE